MANGAARRTRARVDLRSDAGGAIVEFIGMSLLLLVPLVYLVVLLAQIQAATFAAELAAREAARGAVVAAVGALEDGASPDRAIAAANARAGTATRVALEDFGFDAERSGVLVLECSTATCFEPGSDIYAHVDVTVTLPGVPELIAEWMPLEITVSADSVGAVDGFASTQ